MRDSDNRRFLGLSQVGFVYNKTIIEPLSNAAEGKTAEEQNKRHFHADDYNRNKNNRLDKLREWLSAFQILINNMGIANSADHKNRNAQRNKRKSSKDNIVFHVRKERIAAAAEIFDNVLIENDKTCNHTGRGGSRQSPETHMTGLVFLVFNVEPGESYRGAAEVYRRCEP